MILKNMFYNPEYLNRFAMMLNFDQLQKLENTRIIVFGCGGVGGALIHFLARSGVKNIDIVDFDKIDITNINRQLIAYHSNIGKLKVDELKGQLHNINPDILVNTFPIKYSEETESEIDLTKYDIIIDCVDDIKAKKLLITKANLSNTYILSAMGAGNRYSEIPQFVIDDIKKTSYDPIAKILRKFCAENCINKLEVCYTKQKALKFNCQKIASVVYYPINMATVMTAKIINKILHLGDKDGNNRNI